MTDLAARPSASDALTGNDWWKSAVIYQVYPRSFADSNGDGVGDLPGIVQHLDYLATLGVDAIWLSPVYASPADDNGYDISDYQSIDPAFGTLDDFDELVAQTHARGMKLILDLVVNHTSDEHPWFVDSASSPSSARRDWYWWRPPLAQAVGGEAGAEPNNWESFFGGSTWAFDEASGEYYLHLFSKKQPDLNWENPEVRAAIYSMMNWWLDRGVDGFRMDVINLISKYPDLPNGEVAPGRRFGDGFPWYSYGPRIHEFLQEMHESVFSGRDGQFVTVGEMPGVTVPQAQLFTDPARRELDMVFQFDHVGLDHGPDGKFDSRPLDVRELKASLARWQDGLAATGWNSLYWNNHDQPRAVSRFGNDGDYWLQSAQALAAILHLQRGTPYIFQGEELGMTNAPFTDISQIRDIESINYFNETLESTDSSPELVLERIRRIGRDNARTPMQWTADAHGGFTAGEPWIGAHPNHVDINAAAQVGVDGSVFEFYRELIRLRHDERVVALGDFRMLALQHPTLFAFERTLDDESLVVLANLDVAPLDLAEASDVALEGMTTVLGNYPTSDPSTSLRPWEVRVLARGRK